MIRIFFVLIIFVSFTNVNSDTPVTTEANSMPHDPQPNECPMEAVNIQSCYLGIRVEMEFYEKAEVENYSHRKTLQSSEHFRSRFNSVERSLSASQRSSNSNSNENLSSRSSNKSYGGSVSGGGYGFSAEASFQMAEMSASMKSSASTHAGSQGTSDSQHQGTTSEEVDSNASTISEEIAQRTTFNNGFLQTYRFVTTTLSIDGQYATMTELKYIDSVPISDHNNLDQLEKRAEKAINYKFGPNPKGRICRNTYSECGCKTCQECNICELKEYVDVVEQINKKIDHYLPIGTIIPWVNRPHLTSDRTKSEIPDGWQRCDGTTITAPSPWAGEMTPNINGEGRFLRGGSDGDLLKREEDSLQQHNHGLSDSGHSHGYNDKFPGYTGVDGQAGPLGQEFHSDRWDASHPSTTHQARSNIRVTNVNGARTSGETRPKNIRVVYIMKVF